MNLGLIASFVGIGLALEAGWLPMNVAAADGGAAASGGATVDYNPCQRIKASAACNACMGDNPDNPQGFWTGIGCISTNPVAATRDLLQFMLGVGGLFVVFQILVGSFQLVVSRGNPQALQQARERITNSVIALLLIVFSVTILEFVGKTVLHIPGFFDGVVTGK